MKNATLEDAVTGVLLHERIVKELKTYEMKKVITNLWFILQIEDAAAMSSLVDSLTEQCFNEEQFLSLAGRFFSYLAQNVKVETDGVTLRSLLIQK